MMPRAMPRTIRGTTPGMIRPRRPSLFALLWLATQGGDYNDLDHSAHAWLAAVAHRQTCVVT